MNLSVYLFYQRDVWRLFFFSKCVLFFVLACSICHFTTFSSSPACNVERPPMEHKSSQKQSGPIRSPPHFWSGTQSFFILVTFIRLESKVLWLRSQGGVSSLLISVYIRKSICYFKVTWTEYSSEPFLITCCPSSDCPSAVRMFVYFSHI